MTPRTVALAVAGALGVVACGGSGPRTAPLPPAGSTGEGKTAADDGTGLLARASVKFTTGPTDDALETFADDPQRTGNPGYDDYGGYQYGGDVYGGGLYGGASYANYSPTAPGAWSPVNRTLDYEIKGLGDAGAVAGTVVWASAPGERRVSSPCGEIDNPTLHLGAHGEAGGAIVYLDQIKGGRPLAVGNRPLVVGGTVEKIDCALRPTAQVLSPAPGPVTVYTDDKRTVMVAKAGKADPVTVKLAPGGYKQLGVALGVTTIGDEAGTLVPAWIVAPGHPYFALTDDAGRFRISDVVPGTYKLVVWHPPVVTGWRDGKPQYGAPVVVTRTVKVAAYTIAKADVSLK